MWRWKHEGVLEDTDGTLVVPRSALPRGSQHFSSLVPSNGLVQGYFSSECVQVAGYQGRVCNDLKFRRFAVNGVAPSSIARYTPMILSLGNATDSIPWGTHRKTKPNGWLMTLPVQEGNNARSIGLQWVHNPRVDTKAFSYDQGEFLRREQILLHLDYI